MSISALLYLLLLVIFALLVVCYGKIRKRIKCLFFTACSGMCALGCIWVLGHFIVLPFTVTPFTLAVSAALGIPGVMMLLFFPLI